jgi:hypothetical protein
MGMPEKQNDGMEGEQRLAAGGKETTTAAKADPAGAPPPLTQAYGGPYLLVNTAVNLAKCSQLAWQERRAASFLLSPGYCGFETPMGVAENRESGCYRPTARFASSPKPLTLGDAMATSGAAANPTMGFHSKTAYSVLLALFNVRLGRWVGNPTCDNTRAGSKPGSSLWPRIRGTVKWEEAWVQSSPRFSLWYLIKEAFNSTSDQDRFLQLSDGGHFDNLGLYALVKRRCRYIVCCDAGADGNFEYEDLGNAIRKCRIDLGVEIDIDVSSLHPGGDGHCEVPCAVGRIRYPSEKRAQSRVGTLIYIKPCKAVDMPSDVVNYALTHAVFPHETTADQFFSESQFESYRELGCHLARRALKLEGEENIARLFPRLQRRWYSRRNFESATFTRHAATLDQLFDRLRKDPQLALLDRQFYPSWREVFSDPPARREEAFWVPVTQPEVFRSCFYFCNSLIQLMENVFLDLDLQERQQYEHPDNRGWLNLFRHWSWSGMLRVTWALSAPTYGVRFQEFCKHTLGLGLGKPGWDTLGETEWNATRDYHAEGRRSQSEITGQITGEAAAVHLNFVEWQQICAILGEQYDSRIAVFRMSLELDVGGINRPNVKLPVAYAVVEDNKLLMYRVQDHVRKMGLGRQGLLLLLKVTNDPPQSAVLALGEENRMCRDLLASGEMMSEDAASKAVSHFSEMFDSVCHEWQRFPNA